MPIQAPQWTEFLSCPICCHEFDREQRNPISLGCGHTVCRGCLAKLQRNQCPYDQTIMRLDLEQLPVNSALLSLVKSPGSAPYYNGEESDSTIDFQHHLPPIIPHNYAQHYITAVTCIRELALILKPYTGSVVNGSSPSLLSRPMQRKLVTLINCQLVEEEGRARAVRAARSLGERTVTELILHHQNHHLLSANLWAAVRSRGCQFLGPAMQEELLKLVLLALEDGSALSRKVLVMFVVQRLEPHFPQASKTSIGHVVQLLYRASCFKVSKRDGDSSLMQLKEEFCTYDALRREHDAQIVQIATEAGLRIAPDQWSSLLYGDTAHKSHMQSIIDKLQTPQSFGQSVQELVIALQRTGDPGQLSSLRPQLELLAAVDPSPECSLPDWSLCSSAMEGVKSVVAGLVQFIQHHGNRKITEQNHCHNAKYKTSFCRDLSMRGGCPRGNDCTFAHSDNELDRFRMKSKKHSKPMLNGDFGNHAMSGSYQNLDQHEYTEHGVGGLDRLMNGNTLLEGHPVNSVNTEGNETNGLHSYDNSPHKTTNHQHESGVNNGNLVPPPPDGQHRDSGSCSLSSSPGSQPLVCPPPHPPQTIPPLHHHHLPPPPLPPRPQLPPPPLQSPQVRHPPPPPAIINKPMEHPPIHLIGNPIMVEEFMASHPPMQPPPLQQPPPLHSLNPHSFQVQPSQPLSVIQTQPPPGTLIRTTNIPPQPPIFNGVPPGEYNFNNFHPQQTTIFTHHIPPPPGTPSPQFIAHAPMFPQNVELYARPPQQVFVNQNPLLNIRDPTKLQASTPILQELQQDHQQQMEKHRKDSGKFDKIETADDIQLDISHKSLDELKERQEAILARLENILDKDEINDVANKVENGETVSVPGSSLIPEYSSTYSIWTTGANLFHWTKKNHKHSYNNGNCTDASHSKLRTEAEEFIPFDPPILSRFGPISRCSGFKLSDENSGQSIQVSAASSTDSITTPTAHRPLPAISPVPRVFYQQAVLPMGVSLVTYQPQPFEYINTVGHGIIDPPHLHMSQLEPSGTRPSDPIQDNRHLGQEEYQRQQLIAAKEGVNVSTLIEKVEELRLKEELNLLTCGIHEKKKEQEFGPVEVDTVEDYDFEKDWKFDFDEEARDERH